MDEGEVDKGSLGQSLLLKSLITERQLEEALTAQRRTNSFLGETLVSLGYIQPKDLGPMLARALGVSFVNPRECDVPHDVFDLVPQSFIRQHMVMPLKVEEDRLFAAMVDPLNLSVLDDLKIITGLPVVPMLSMERDLLAAINQHFDSRVDAEKAIRDIDATRAENGGPVAEPSTEELWTLAADAPVVRLVNSVLQGAFNAGASDIHLEPQKDKMRVRYRLDGLLYDQMTIPRSHQAAVISRVKIMARLNIAERRLPQDGRIPMVHHGKEYDLRISSMPSVFGEKVVIRVLEKSSMRFSFEQLGCLPEQQNSFEWLLARPYGMILVTGPTGSGKSTTLYAALASINEPTKNILTIEDPVEYQLPGITQTEVNTKVGVTFARGLRTMVRQDPDVIMVGEIRDVETAEIAVQAALTGHLVFSTLHTNDAAGALVRLANMGVEPFLISSSVIGVVGQRLVREICPNCKEYYAPSPEVLSQMKSNGKSLPRSTQLARGVGCRECNQIGYRGRSGVFEVMRMSEALRELVLQRQSASAIREKARQEGMQTMKESALEKVLMGTTSAEEIMRVIYVEEE
ncbi:MAG: type II secretion system protein GspE [Armatimonadetes bacterium]|nr:type II secretion system protein GspE [Armatimonadota bacterium]NIM23517.1 type II secretion system protein GspE [Armatimonadota bacterium]NIM67383.1 type II secretion system protein GspE [Armatimonadota bacterium]NIM75884.1 type II secretion system protein GspE [Armatimonadota bacterium]NIN05569.1 type II secretion system protein GspE [Armatimonadota bacterium]